MVIDLGIAAVCGSAKKMAASFSAPGMFGPDFHTYDEFVWTVRFRCACKVHFYVCQDWAIPIPCARHFDSGRAAFVFARDGADTGPFAMTTPVLRVSWPPLANTPPGAFDIWYAQQLYEANVQHAARIKAIVDRQERMERMTRQEPREAPPPARRAVIDTVRHMVAALREGRKR